MKKIFVGLFAACLTAFAQAETMQVESTTYWVIVDPGQPVELPSGAKGMATMRVHGTSVRSDGVTNSQWCTGHQGVSAQGQQGGAGYCSIIADNGDMLYVSFINGADGMTKWSVMGGSGGYAGATGGGTSKTVSERGDGQAWTTTSTGKISVP